MRIAFFITNHSTGPSSTSYPLPTVNSLAVKEIKNSDVKANFSLKTVQAWIGLEKEEIQEFCARSSALVKNCFYGKEQK